jgi:hypothetical protein
LLEIVLHVAADGHPKLEPVARQRLDAAAHALVPGRGLVLRYSWRRRGSQRGARRALMACERSGRYCWRRRGPRHRLPSRRFPHVRHREPCREALARRPNALVRDEHAVFLPSRCLVERRSRARTTFKAILLRSALTAALTLPARPICKRVSLGDARAPEIVSTKISTGL